MTQSKHYIASLTFDLEILGNLLNNDNPSLTQIDAHYRIMEHRLNDIVEQQLLSADTLSIKPLRRGKHQGLEAELRQKWEELKAEYMKNVRELSGEIYRSHFLALLAEDARVPTRNVDPNRLTGVPLTTLSVTSGITRELEGFLTRKKEHFKRNDAESVKGFLIKERVGTLEKLNDVMHPMRSPSKVKNVLTSIKLRMYLKFRHGREFQRAVVDAFTGADPTADSTENEVEGDDPSDNDRSARAAAEAVAAELAADAVVVNEGAKVSGGPVENVTGGGAFGDDGSSRRAEEEEPMEPVDDIVKNETREPMAVTNEIDTQTAATEDAIDSVNPTENATGAGTSGGSAAKLRDEEDSEEMKLNLDEEYEADMRKLDKKSWRW